MPRHVSFGRTVRHAFLGVIGAGALGSVGAGCLDRPVVPSSPVTTARFVTQDTQKGVNKIDLVFMIDNSSSMADKQAILKDAVPDLVNRLVNPRCVSSADQTQVAGMQPQSPTDACPDGYVREFEPIKDIHIGILSSSLGGHGADTCSPALQNSYNPTQADMGHLLSRKQGGTVSTYQDAGFLFWDPDAKGTPPGESQLGSLVTNFQEMVVGVDQTGCGFEASLEAVYRFLADPHPYGSIALENNAVVKQDEDTVLIQQRAAFLRPDSLLAVVSITDENDCSVREDEGQNYYVVVQSTSNKKSFRMFRATSACQTNPNDKCCTSCALPDIDGCTAHADDAECQKNGGKYTDAEDALNLRCFDQKRRFGVDFLYPPQRYVDMMTQTMIGSDPNPIFSNLQGTDSSAVRTPQDVFWAMIAGVPWQDIARDPNDLKKGYLPTTPVEGDISGQNFIDQHIWDRILGENGQGPGDPLMLESVDPRMGTYPVTNTDLVQPSSMAANPPMVDPALPNGHEWDISVARDDLQYACIFPLPTPRDCASQPDSCDCSTGLTTQNPLCQDATGKPTTTQFRAKGYPGTRHLAVAKGLGAQGIVASICPANVTDPNADDYGYRPAIGAIIDRLKSRLQGKCLPRQLQPNLCVDKSDKTYGQVPCVVVEVTPGPQDGSSCPPCDGREGRETADPAVVAGLQPPPPAGSCICGINQLSGNDLQTCETEGNPTGITGFCYVDPSLGIGNPALVEKCPSTGQRIIRFVGDNTPAKGATTYYACQEAAFNPSAGADAGAATCQ